MRPGVLVVLATTLAIPAYAATITPGPSATDYLFQCSATFIIKSHQLKNDPRPTKTELRQSARYMEKFNDLAAKAEASFEQHNRTRKAARDYLQQHVDTMSGIFTEDTAAMRRFLRLCDKRFPD